jgi:dihydrofolate reductase
MRKVVLSHWITFDGYAALDPDTDVHRYMARIDDPEHDRYFLDRLNSVAEHAMGSTTYREMSAFWPQSDIPIADPMNRIPKLVFSNSEVDDSWGPVRVIRGDTTEAVAALKAEEGGDILVHGGTTFVHSLLRLELIDEYRLNVLPAAIGTGVPLFEDLGRVQPLHVLATTTFPSGVQEVVLAPNRDA